MTAKEVRVEEQHLSLSEAADALNISERTAYRWIKSGKLRAYKPGRDYWIPESAIKEVVEESRVRPKVRTARSVEPSLFNGLEDERRLLRPWITYLSRRVEWREKIFQRKPDQEFNNPWLSLETAIQWAVNLGVESADLRHTIKREVLTADTLTDEADELRALLDRFVEIERRTDERVNAMMADARLGEEEKRARLELIHGERSA